jgi:AcrR family transcriptional regulator
MARPTTPLLSRELIVDTAVSIIDAEGTEALSMRRLASALGVRSPSIYHHFRNKDEILGALVDGIHNSIDLTQAGPDWETALTSYAHQLRAALIEHPHVVEFLALRPVTKDAGLRIYEHMIATLMRAGWTVTFSRDVTIAVENLVYGAALMANAPDIELTADLRSRYPTLARFADQPPHERPDDGFQTGFHALLDGLRQARPVTRAGRGRAR